MVMEVPFSHTLSVLVVLGLSTSTSASTITISPFNDGFIRAGKKCSLSYCGGGTTLKVYQTEPLSECYGCNRRLVLTFTKPSAFVNTDYTIDKAVLKMFKIWNGGSHWYGNDTYIFRGVTSGYTRHHLIDAGINSSLAPTPLHPIGFRQWVVIPKKVNAWVELDVTNLMTDLFSTVGPSEDVSLDLAGAKKGCLSQFKGSRSDGGPELEIDFTLDNGRTISPSVLLSSAPTTSPTTDEPTALPTMPPTLAPNTNGFRQVKLRAINDGFILAQKKCDASYCGDGSALKVYQTSPLTTCYGCNRRTVMSFQRPSNMLRASYEITSATLRMHKDWDGNTHGWAGNDTYIFRGVTSNYTRKHFIDAGIDKSLAPKPLHPIGFRQWVVIPSKENAWITLDLKSLMTDLFANDYKSDIVTFDIAGAMRGCLSAFRGSTSKLFPELIIKYNLIESSSPSAQKSTSRPSQYPTFEPTPNPSTVPTPSPTVRPSVLPTPSHPTVQPSWLPSSQPTGIPTSLPTSEPTSVPTPLPTPTPTTFPTPEPTPAPTSSPSSQPTALPTIRYYPVDEEGNVVYPTNSAGDKVFATDNNGGTVLPTDADGETISSLPSASSAEKAPLAAGTATAVISVVIVLVLIVLAIAIAYVMLKKKSSGSQAQARQFDNPMYNNFEDKPNPVYGQVDDTSAQNTSGYLDIPASNNASNVQSNEDIDSEEDV